MVGLAELLDLTVRRSVRGVDPWADDPRDRRAARERIVRGLQTLTCEAVNSGNRANADAAGAVAPVDASTGLPGSSGSVT